MTSSNQSSATACFPSGVADLSSGAAAGRVAFSSFKGSKLLCYPGNGRRKPGQNRETIGDPLPGTSLHKALNTSSGRYVALKFESPYHFNRNSVATQLTLMRRVRSPFVVKGRGLYRCGRRAALVMDWVEGSTLRAVSRESGLPPAEAVRLVRQICLGVDSIHRAGLSHNDLRSQNVMISPGRGQSHVVIIDFDHADFIVAGESGHQTSLRRPGLRNNKPEPVARDIRGIAAIMFELLTGHTLPVILVQGRQTVDPNLERFMIAPELACAIRRCWAPNDETRFTSVRNLLHAINIASRALPVE